MDIFRELFRAYAIDIPDISQSKLNNFAVLLSKGKEYKYISRGIYSDHSPETIIRTACKIGMHIPFEFRYGLRAYEYFINNAVWYSGIFDGITPDENSSKDTLMRYSDFNIFFREFVNTVRYNSRPEAINKLLENRKRINGRFTVQHYPFLETIVVMYTKDTVEKLYSLKELIGSIDKKEKIIKIPYSSSVFSKDSIKQLYIELRGIKSKILNNRTCPEKLSRLISDIKLIQRCVNIEV
uniref:Uncharacterized protein n=1 Tax=Pithovirus LCDPAC01 TaxID=2506600 RepID=A0A481YN12_9VIRU|nr:MAG: hypothetical protein LCDPAC01_02010 [Pithovirus LCDPAC01]